MANEIMRQKDTVVKIVVTMDTKIMSQFLGDDFQRRQQA